MSVMVFCEASNNSVSKVSLQLISEAHRLAEQLHTTVDALIVADHFDNFKILATYGAHRAITYLHDQLQDFRSLTYARQIVAAIKKYQPQIVLFGASYLGRDIAPRVASNLACGLTADCTSLRIGDFQDYKNILLQMRPAFGGNIVATIVSPQSHPSMATVREGVMIMQEFNTDLHVAQEHATIEQNDLQTTILNIVREEKMVDLTNSKIIVAAGMGVKDKAGIALLKELAQVIGAEIAGSRPVIDAGLLSKEHQVGQTGVTVRPNLYMAFAISGQIQHLAGISQAQRILAVNTDPLAPIFKIATYAIVADFQEVVTHLLRAYQQL